MNIRIGLIMLAVSIPAPTFSQEPVLASFHDPSLGQVNDRFNDAIKNDAIEELLALYAENAIFLAPNEPPVDDPRVIRDNYLWIFEQGAELSHTLDRSFVAEDGTLAVMIGRYRLKGGSPELNDSGSYLFTLVSTGSSWEIVADIFNSDIRSKLTKSSNSEGPIHVLDGDVDVGGDLGRKQKTDR